MSVQDKALSGLDRNRELINCYRDSLVQKETECRDSLIQKETEWQQRLHECLLREEMMKQVGREPLLVLESIPQNGWL